MAASEREGREFKAEGREEGTVQQLLFYGLGRGGMYPGTIGKSEDRQECERGGHRRKRVEENSE